MAQEAKTMHQLVKDGSNICSKVGQVNFAMGMRMAPITVDPKKVAEALLDSADEYEAVADTCRLLASEVCDYDAANASRIIIPNGSQH